MTQVDLDATGLNNEIVYLKRLIMDLKRRVEILEDINLEEQSNRIRGRAY